MKKTIIPDCAVDKDENIVSAVNGWGITEANIHVNLIQIAVGSVIDGLDACRLGNSSVGAKGHGKFTGGDKVAIVGEIKKILVVLELTTSCNPV